MKTSPFFIFCALFLMASVVPGLANANDGRIVTLEGAVTLNGAAVTPRTRVRSGDTIETGPSAAVRLILADSSVIDLRSRTRFKVEDFQYKKEEPSKARSFFNLLRGTFRLVTGAVSKLGTGRVRVRAGTATIGIRGSFQEVTFDEVDVSVLSASGTATITRPNSPPITVGPGFVGSVNINSNQSSVSEAQSSDPVISAVLAVRDAAPEDRAQQLAEALASNDISDGERAVMVAAVAANAADLGVSNNQLIEAVTTAAETNPDSAAMSVFMIASVTPELAEEAAQRTSEVVPEAVQESINTAKEAGETEATPPPGAVTNPQPNNQQEQQQETGVSGEDTAENPNVTSATTND